MTVSSILDARDLPKMPESVILRDDAVCWLYYIIYISITQQNFYFVAFVMFGIF